jgi:hypothetical protein
VWGEAVVLYIAYSYKNFSHRPSCKFFLRLTEALKGNGANENTDISCGCL